MTELNDHLKLLFARAGRLFCRGCGREVRRDTPGRDLGRADCDLTGGTGPRVLVGFRVPVPAIAWAAEAVKALLAQQGYVRTLDEEGPDSADRDPGPPAPDRRGPRSRDGGPGDGPGPRSRPGPGPSPRGRTGTPATPWRFSADLHCPDCDIAYRDPSPNSFSFNSPLGACETCRGFGRTIGIDWGLVIPDPAKSLHRGGHQAHSRATATGRVRRT